MTESRGGWRCRPAPCRPGCPRPARPSTSSEAAPLVALTTTSALAAAVREAGQPDPSWAAAHSAYATARLVTGPGHGLLRVTGADDDGVAEFGQAGRDGAAAVPVPRTAIFTVGLLPGGWTGSSAHAWTLAGGGTRTAYARTGSSLMHSPDPGGSPCAPDLRRPRHRVPDLRLHALPRRGRRRQPGGGLGVLGAVGFTPGAAGDRADGSTTTSATGPTASTSSSPKVRGDGLGHVGTTSRRCSGRGPAGAPRLRSQGARRPRRPGRRQRRRRHRCSCSAGPRRPPPPRWRSRCATRR